MVNEAEYLQKFKQIRLDAKEAIFNHDIELAKRQYNKLLKLNPRDQEANHILALLPAPCHSQNLTDALNNSLNNLIKLYNKALHYHVDKAGYQMIDFYSATANDMGFSNEIYHLDGVHLKTDVIEKVVNFNLLK